MIQAYLGCQCYNIQANPMGNVLLEGPKKGDPAQQYQRWLEENPDLVGKQILSENKLFRTSSYKFNGRNLILKVFFKRDQFPLAQYLKIFEFFNQITQKLKATNIAPLKLFHDKDNQAFIVAYRQKIAQTLEDILCAKPSTTEAKKKWMIYQMIKSVYTVHKNFNFYHGHIRTSNFIVTSYGYLMLTDFAFYKPLYMIEDSEEGLPQFRLFYGSSVGNCTLAPEKITEQAELKAKQRSPAKVFANYQPPPSHNASFSVSLQSSNYGIQTVSGQVSIPPNILTLSTARSQMDQSKYKNSDNFERTSATYSSQMSSLQKMDIFSLGCSILEVLRDGKPILNFESYLKFKKGQIVLDSFIDDACKSLDKGQELNKLLKSMLSLSPEDRPSIEQVMLTFNNIININTYSLIEHCTAAFSTTSFFLPDLRIALMQSIMKFIELQERGTSSDFKILAPKCFESFQALRIFRSILKNKIIHVGYIPENSILNKIMDSNEKQNVVDSEEEEIMNQESDMRKQFFVPLVAKRSNISMRVSTASIPKLEKILTPPEWNGELKSLVEPKFRGTRLTPSEILKNRFQDLVEQYRKTQSIREIRIKQNSSFYKEYNMVVRIIFSCIRGCKYNSSKLIGIQLLMAIAKESTDSVRLVRMIPSLINLLDDPDTLTSKYAFNSIIDVFYMFIDPFSNEDSTHYYDIIIEMFINCIKTPRLRINLFRRLSEVYSICEWLEVHIKKICKKVETKNNLKKLVDVLKNDFGSYQNHEIRELMMNIPDIMWPEMFEFFISFLNSQKILGLQKGISIAQIDFESHKKIVDVIDNCIETSLDENGFSLFYAIKYFTARKVHVPSIVKKIGPLVIHPHLWVREQAKEYLKMCLEQNPPTRIFFLFRQVFSPPFPLQPKDLNDDILLPQPLMQSEVDFMKKKLKSTRKLGLTEKHFLEYLEKVKASKSYPITKEQQVQNWLNLSKSSIEQKTEPTSFNSMIKKTINELYEANFLYYVGNAKSPFKPNLKEEEKRKAYEQLNDALKKMNILSLEDNQVAYEKKDFFISLSTIVNSNFEKLLTRFIKEDKSNKIRISQSIYLIMETLYKFEQFNIKQTFKLGEYNIKMMEGEKNERPKGTLITEIYEHKDMITCLENVADRFLISASYDGTVRVYNVRKVQSNITCQSEGVYEVNSDNSEEKVRINSLAAFENTYTIAVATNRGNIRIFQIQRMKSKGFDNRASMKSENTNSELLKYAVGGEIQKILTFKNENRNQCFCFVTAEGVLGVQDIRTRSKTMSCNLGKERGLPKSLAFSTFGPSILIGTLDGYVLTYDIRCNLISSIKQLQIEQSPVSITGIYPTPLQTEGRNLFAFTYPSKYYQFSYFDIYIDSQQFPAERLYTSCDRDDIISMPVMVNKTKEENFKLCNNTLTQKIYYKQLADFNRNFKILDYLSDPFTIKEAKIREVWMDRCKHRYNQIYSVYNRKVLPFLEHTQAGIMTNMNPCITCPAEKKLNRNLSVLVDRIETRQYYETEKLVTCKPPNSKIFTFQDEQNVDYLTSCKSVGGMIFAGGWDSVIKVYK